MDTTTLGPNNGAGLEWDAGNNTASVLNPTLYERLVRQFGSVIIAKQGEAMFGGGYEYVGGHNRYSPLSSGAFCLQRGAVDTRHRLWINHRWGVGLDPTDPLYNKDDRFWWMCVCYNEGCMENPANRKALRNMIYGGVGRELHGQRVTVRPGKRENLSLGVVDLPGHCQRLDNLPVEHIACQYLLGRGISPQVVGERYDVSYCNESSEFPAVVGKMIIPIYMDGQMVGWQARPPYDIDWKAAGQPKYYNRPRTNKRLMLYGADMAKSLPFCIIVEGVTDVWAVGSGAVSLLGKDMSYVQAGLIIENWQAAVIALDADAQDRAVRMQDMLERDKLRGKVVNVVLPDGTDPASLDADFFWDLVYGGAANSGIDLLNP